MRYVREEDATRLHVPLDAVGSIDKTGSVLGMQRRFGWKRGGQIRVGSYIYNVGPDEVARLRSRGVVRGE